VKLRGRQAIPLADVRELRDPVRRTAIVRRALAVCLVVVIAAAALLAEQSASSEAALAKGTHSGVIVLDLSASIGAPGRKGILDALQYLAETGQEFGLVVFSSTAYEMVPPGTSSAELQPLLRALAPFTDVCLTGGPAPCAPGTRRVAPDTAEGQRIRRESVTPWDQNFRAGTVISTGLVLARQALERHHMRNRGVLLVSDLDDSLLDIPRMTNELITYRTRGIPIHLVALAPFDDDRFLFERMLGRGAFVDHTDMTPGRQADKRRAERAGVPEGLAGLALLLLMLLALNEHFCGRLAWRAER
jgi:hypothetical protein